MIKRNYGLDIARIRIFLYDKLKVKKLLQLLAKPIDKFIYPVSMD